jgi:hypothetical protein
MLLCRMARYTMCKQWHITDKSWNCPFRAFLEKFPFQSLSVTLLPFITVHTAHPFPLPFFFIHRQPPSIILLPFCTYFHSVYLCPLVLYGLSWSCPLQGLSVTFLPFIPPTSIFFFFTNAIDHPFPLFPHSHWSPSNYRGRLKALVQYLRMLLGRSFGAENVNKAFFFFRFATVSKWRHFYNDVAFYYCDHFTGLCTESSWKYRQLKCSY